MINLQVLVSERCIGASIFTVLDIITAANFVYRKQQGTQQSLIDVKLIGAADYQHAYNGQRIGPLDNMMTVERPDVLILPGLIEAVMPAGKIAEALKAYDHWIPTLRRWHGSGTIVAAACGGNLLLNASGLTRQRPVTCHWATEQAAKSLFPNESFEVDKLLLDHGDIVSAGGASAIGQLVLYILERMAGRDLALYCAKLMLIDIAYRDQAPFAMFSPNKQHDDKLVRQMQDWLEQHYKGQIHVSEMVEKWPMSERQLGRRFKQATGESPGAYLQKLRIEHVKRGLESGQTNGHQLIWEAGYEDVSSFRRLFKRETSMTMNEYRQRFGQRFA